MKAAFTERVLRDAEKVVWDLRQPGLYYDHLRGFFATYWQNGANHAEKLGNFPALSIQDARALAAGTHGQVARYRLRHRKRGPLYLQACEGYAKARLKRPQSIATFSREMTSGPYLADWVERERTLRSLTELEIRDRHLQIAAEHGPYIANRIIRQLNAVWEYTSLAAATEDPTWPTLSPTRLVERCPEVHNDKPIPLSRLPAWRAAVETLSPVRRLYNLVVILTGLRRTDAATLLWRHVNLTDSPKLTQVYDPRTKAYTSFDLPARSMIRPVPKGGPAKAFVLPLAQAVIDLLTRAFEAHTEDDGGWVFPARSIKARHCAECADLGLPGHAERSIAHLVEPKEDHELLYSPHRLRHTFASVAAGEANVPWKALKTLLNHARSKDVTERYLHVDVESLRPYAESVATCLLEAMMN